MSGALTVSVVVPVYNGAAFLDEALRSLVAQSRPAAQIVVIDDGSTDDSFAVATAFAATHSIVEAYQQPNGGSASARNAGIAHSDGNVLAFLDADDLAMPTKLALQVGMLEADQSLHGTVGTQEMFFEPGAPTPIWMDPPPGWLPEAATRHSRHGLMSMVVRRELFDAIGGFDETLRFGEDTDWLLRAWDSGHRVPLIDDLVVRRRIHHNNLTQDSDAFRRAQFEVLAKRIRRRRGTTT